MTTISTLTPAQVTRAVTVLSHPGLIRLVTEIDDNGPVNRRMLGRTFADLARHQIRHALDAGRTYRLIRAGHHSEPCYLLTGRGVDLADVYDSLARWARAHHFPTPAGDFVARVQQTLALLRHEPVLSALTEDAAGRHQAQRAVGADLLRDGGTAISLHGPWTAVSEWISANPSVLDTSTRRATTAAAKGESTR